MSPRRHPVLLMLLLSVGLAALMSFRPSAVGGEAAPPPPAADADAADGGDPGIRTSVRVFEAEAGEWACEVTFFNQSGRVRVVPRFPGWVHLDYLSEHLKHPPDSVTIRTGPAWTRRPLGKIRLVKDEGFVKRVPLGRLEPGEYRVRLKLPNEFATLTPPPEPFTVPADDAGHGGE